jgi:hypothetical protein
MNKLRAISVLEQIKIEVELSMNRFENLKKMVDDVIFWIDGCDGDKNPDINPDKVSGPTGDRATDFIIATLKGEK